MSIAFAGGAIERAAHLRKDFSALAQLRANGKGRFLALWRGKPLVVDDHGMSLAWLPENSAILKDARYEVFLGMHEGIAHFAIDLGNWEGPADLPEETPWKTENIHHPELPETHYFCDLRAALPTLSPLDAGDAATAKSILGWHEIHQFCANCGTKTNLSASGWQRDCPACKRMHFPRIDPVVIMLVTSGNDVLLGRSPGWPDGMYSLLAGFMEPGETIAEAVIREVVEETDIHVTNVRYVDDQPWPFVSSLMIGMRADATTRDITVDPIEIEAARWISREDLMETMDGSNPELLPARKGSIARFILDKWLADTL